MWTYCLSASSTGPTAKMTFPKELYPQMWTYCPSAPSAGLTAKDFYPPEWTYFQTYVPVINSQGVIPTGLDLLPGLIRLYHPF